jgi:hypothetical protein
MAVSIEMRKPAVVDNRNMRRRIGAGLLVAAASITLAGVALQVSGGSKAATQQGPTAAQHIAFVMEEHGYTAQTEPTKQQELARSIVAANAALTPTAEQRIAFVQEEHGYTNTAPIAEPRTEFLQSQAALTPTAEQRIAFVLEEHGYSLASTAFEARSYSIVPRGSDLSPIAQEKLSSMVEAAASSVFVPTRALGSDGLSSNVEISSPRTTSYGPQAN